MCGLIAIILTVLKWLGIVLLAVICLILAVAVCLLFVPVKYHVYVEKKEQLAVRGYASWLLHFLHLSVQVKEGKESHILRVVGIPVLNGKQKKAALKKKKRKKKYSKKKTSKRQPFDGSQGKGNRQEQEETADKAMLLQKQDAEKRSVNPLPEQEKNISEHGQIVQEPTQNMPESEKTVLKSAGTPKTKDFASGTGKRNKFFQKIHEFFLLIRRLFCKIKNRLAAFWKFLRERRSRKSGGRRTKNSKFAKIKTILADDNTLQLWRLVWSSLTTLWKHSRPRKLTGRIHFGTSDPCTTGQILGLVGAGLGLAGCRIEIVPDFEDSVLEGYLEIKGRIQIVQLLLVAKKVFFSEQWKHFKQQLQ